MSASRKHHQYQRTIEGLIVHRAQVNNRFLQKVQKIKTATSDFKEPILKEGSNQPSRYTKAGRTSVLDKLSGISPSLPRSDRDRAQRP